MSKKFGLFLLAAGISVGASFTAAADIACTVKLVPFPVAGHYVYETVLEVKCGKVVRQVSRKTVCAQFFEGDRIVYSVIPDTPGSCPVKFENGTSFVIE